MMHFKRHQTSDTFVFDKGYYTEINQHNRYTEYQKNPEENLLARPAAGIDVHWYYKDILKNGGKDNGMLPFYRSKATWSQHDVSYIKITNLPIKDLLILGENLPRTAQIAILIIFFSFLVNDTN
jgi:hypothetical protein